MMDIYIYEKLHINHLFDVVMKLCTMLQNCYLSY